MAVVKRGKILRGDLANYDGRSQTSTRTDATGGTLTGLSVGHQVDVLQVFGAGTSRTAGTIDSALRYIGTDKASLVLSPGTWTIDSSLTIPANLSCHIPAGCVLSVSVGITLTINGPIRADQAQIFSGAGTIRVKGRTIPQWWGAAGDGTTNDATALQAAIDSAEAGGMLYCPTGTYLIGSQLSVGDSTPITISGDGPAKSIIKKGFNGAMLSLGLKSELTQIRLDGNGGSYTGRGVIIETGSGGDGYQNIHDCEIIDTASYCIEYTAPGAGFGSRIVNNRLGTYNRAAFCVKYPANDDNGPRLLANNVTLAPLVDLDDAFETVVTGNFGGEDIAQTLPCIQMTSDSFASVITGNNFVSNTSISIKGNEQIFVGNICRGGYTLESGATNCTVMAIAGEADTEMDTDNSAVQTNEVYGVNHSYTPTWTASITPPSLGNGTITGKYQRFGRRVHLQIALTIGASTTTGSGYWIFSLPTTMPAPGSGNSYGTCRMMDSGTTVYVGVATVSTEVVAHVNAGGAVTASAPFTWASTDTLNIDVVYSI